MAGDAYRAVPILEKLPLQIESMVAFEPHPTNQACSALDHPGGAGSSSSKLHLIVGTKVGHLLMYEVDLRNPNERVQLLRSSKGFSKKSLTQLGVIPECGILLALSDSVITVHDMNVFNFPIITQLERTKGALLFAVDCKKQTSQTGVISTIVRLCVAVRKSLQLYYWKNRKFLELGEDLALPDFPKTISWCGESLFVGVRKEYFRLTITGRLYELFPVHSPNEPNILRLEDYKVALGQDNKLVILDSNGKPAKSNMLEWSNHPSALQFDPPFLVAVLPCYLEVRSLDPDVLMQTISLSEGSRSNRPRLLAWASVGHIFVASTSHIWCLEALPLHRQIPLLLENKEFELALKLNSMRSHPGVDQEKLYQSIQMLHAFDLFVRLKFKESLEVFHELGTDPSHVIGLFPGLLPQDFRSQLSYPGDLPQLSGMDLEDGLLALRDYLTQVRYKLLDESGSNNRSGKEKVRKLSSNPILEGAPTIKSRERMLQIIDTTLVKCFLATTDSLVASFLRLKDNHCHMEETELALKKHQKFDDLIILYQTKNQHRKALEILRSPLLKSTSKTVDYLQRIAKDHFELTLEFAEWVLKEDPEEGLRLFTEDLPEVECLPRAKVMSELEKRCPALVIRYLRHVIEVWQDQNQLLHDVLADRYLKEILDLISKPSSDPDQVDSSQKLCQFRHDFVEFLEASTRYSPEKILVKLPFDSFFEERAILYGKMEQHEKALAVYIYLLGDVSRATQYCLRIYGNGRAASKTVFLTFLRLLLSPPDYRHLGILGINDESDLPSPTPLKPSSKALDFPNIPAALTLLEKHSAFFKPSAALSLFPDDTPLSKFASFLRNNLKAMSVRRKEAQILKGLHFARHLQIQDQRIAAQSRVIHLTDIRICPACKKKFVNQSAFARYPNGDLVHFYCQEVYEQVKGLTSSSSTANISSSPPV